MSITALLLRKCRVARPALETPHGRATIDQHIFYYAARLIAGTYTH